MPQYSIYVFLHFLRLLFAHLETHRLHVHAQQPAVNVLGEIRDFLEANPSEIITIFIEDYVSSPMGLTKVFNASGLLKYWFPVSSMPKNGEDWPLVSEMITQTSAWWYSPPKKPRKPPRASHTSGDTW
ncbi:unnamed protein product [Musa hybrid cultivar]